MVTLISWTRHTTCACVSEFDPWSLSQTPQGYILAKLLTLTFFLPEFRFQFLLKMCFDRRTIPINFGSMKYTRMLLPLIIISYNHIIICGQISRLPEEQSRVYRTKPMANSWRNKKTRKNRWMVFGCSCSRNGRAFGVVNMYPSHGYFFALDHRARRVCISCRHKYARALDLDTIASLLVPFHGLL